MRKPFARLKGFGFILWHARHEFYHMLIGLVWAWFVREQWQEFNPHWITLSVVGSLIPDADHFIYFFTYGRKDNYTVQIRNYLHKHEWRVLVKFIEKGHKYNTHLATHNYYIMGLLLVLSAFSLLLDVKTGVIFFMAMLFHYTFDVFDDMVTLGHINSNWKRWGRQKKAKNFSY